MSEILVVRDHNAVLSFTVDDLMKYHGPLFPGGVAHAFKAMQRGLAALSADGPPERGEIVVETSFGGPGGRDAIEMVTRAVTGGRFTVDKGLGAPWEDDFPRQNYFFRFKCGDRSAELVVKRGLVRTDFIELGRKPDRTEEEEKHLAYLKQEMTDRLLALEADEVYELVTR